MIREQSIEALWAFVEDVECLWFLSDVAPEARNLGWLADKDMEPGRAVLENISAHDKKAGYWMRNATFALLILVAEGEEL